MPASITLESAQRPDSDGFVECSECSAKPGSPTLCPSCHHNRELIHQLRRDANALRDRLEPQERKSAKPELTRSLSVAVAVVLLAVALFVFGLEVGGAAADQDAIPPAANGPYARAVEIASRGFAFERLPELAAVVRDVQREADDAEVLLESWQARARSLLGRPEPNDNPARFESEPQGFSPLTLTPF
jgi:hypothetical protein